jgi:biopolymer transport protein ExbD
MAMKSGGFKRGAKVSSEIPLASTADIAFLLVIFFMVTTVFKRDKNRPITWPKAVAAKKIDEKQKNILDLWMERDGTIYINDQKTPMSDVTAVVAPLYASSAKHLVISIRADAEVPYRFVDSLQKQLVAAGVVRVVFATELAQKMQRARR